jgi:ribosomal protein S18 acetylase RimI-like enzyme
VTKGFDKDPRKCWTLIRISKNGTIEFRMFGATPSLERIVGWAKLCHDLCKEAMTESECEILHVDASNISADIVRQWSELYCEIWKEPPWNEDFWKPTEVWQEIYQEITDNQHGEAFLALDKNKVVGFTHGYSVSRQEMRKVVGSDLLDELFEHTERVYYIDELGVAKGYRGLHISSRLTRSLVQVARGHGLTCITLRTDKQAGAARRLYQKLGFTELTVCDAKYPNRTYWLRQL